MKKQVDSTSKKTPVANGSEQAATEPQEMLKVNDYVVYPLHGIGILTEVIENEEKEKLYKIKLQESDMSISLPLKSVGEAGLRKIISKEDISKVIDNFSTRPASSEDNWRIRFQENIKKLKSGSIENTITLIKQLFIRNKRKTLSTIERKQFESAFEMIIKEVSLASKTSKEQVTSLLSSKLDELTETEDEVASTQQP